MKEKKTFVYPNTSTHIEYKDKCKCFCAFSKSFVLSH